MSFHTSGSYHLLLAAFSPIPTALTIPLLPSLHLSIVTWSVLRALQRVDPTTTFSTLLQVAEGIIFLPPSLSYRCHSSRFHSSHSLLFCLPLILFSLMWRLSFSSSLVNLGAPRAPPLSFSSPTLCFIPFHPFFQYTSMKMRCLHFRKKTRVKAILNVTNFAHLCVCLQETEHPQQVCSNETGDITSKKESKYTDTHINSTLFCKAPLHVSSTAIAFLHLNH